MQSTSNRGPAGGLRLAAFALVVLVALPHALGQSFERGKLIGPAELVSDLAVAFSTVGGAQTGVERTGEDGTFRIPPDTPTDVIISIWDQRIMFYRMRFDLRDGPPLLHVSPSAELVLTLGTATAVSLPERAFALATLPGRHYLDIGFRLVDGRLVGRVCAPRLERVTVEVPGYCPVAIEDLDLVPGQRTERQIRLEVGATVSGLVLTATDHLPVAGAVVVLKSQDDLSQTATCDSLGRFTFQNCRAGMCQVVARSQTTGQTAGPLQILVTPAGLSAVVLEAQ